MSNLIDEARAIAKNAIAESDEWALSPSEDARVRRLAGLINRLADELEQQQAVIDGLLLNAHHAEQRHNQDIHDMEREMRQEMRDAAAEQRWQERMGDDYGSY